MTLISPTILAMSVEVVRYGTLDEAKLDLIAGRVDLLFGDVVALSEGLLKTDQGKDFEFVGPAYYRPEMVRLRRRDRDPQIRHRSADKLNAAIDAIRADGIYDKIAAKYFDFDVYGS